MRDTPDTQTTTLSDSGVLRLASLEDAYDKLTMLVQQLQEQADRSAFAPRSDDTSLTYEIPNSIDRSSKNFGWDSSGNVVATSVASTGSVSFGAFGTDMAATATSAAAVTLLGIDDEILTSAIDVRTFGAVGDGVTDDGAAVSSAIQSLTSGDVLYFPKGTYLLTTYTVESITTNITILGDSGDDSIITGPDTSTVFMSIGASGNIHVKNLGFSTWDTVIRLSTSNVDYVVIDGCNADSLNNLYGDVGATTSGNLDTLRINNCKLSNIAGFAIEMRSTTTESIMVTDNEFRTITGEIAILMGSNDIAVTNNTYIITGNYITDVTGGTETHAIMCFGRSALIADNYIKNVSNVPSTNCEGIYLKTRNSVVTGNTLIDASEADSAIRLKGIERDGVGQADGKPPFGYSNVVANNNIFNTTPFLYNGIHTSVSECLITGNYIENCEKGVASIAQFDVCVTNNIFYNCEVGIQIFAGDASGISNTVISGNIIKETSDGAEGTGIGVWIDASAGQLTNTIINDNIIDTVENSGTSSGILLVCTNDIAFVNIQGNHFDNMDAGINTDLDGGVLGKVNASNNTFSAVTTPMNSDTYTGSLSRAVNNIGFVTENSGVTTGDALATGGTIAHGCAATPTFVSVTAQDTGTSAIWCTIDASDITVNFAGGGSHDFFWEARVR